MQTITLNRFDGGIVNDPRNPSESVSRYTGNFDILTDRNRMSPYRSSEDGHDNQATEKLQNFCVALRTGTTYSLYGLGVVSGGGIAQVQFKNLTTGATIDLDDNNWNKGGNSSSSAGSTSFNLFVYYAKTGYIYGARANTHIWRYDPSGVGAWVDTHQALTYTNIAQGIVHSKDYILYSPYDNKIAKNDNGSWTTTALTLPSHLYITSICEYGNYIAIGCAPLSGIGNSRVFIWDRDTSLATLSDTIDWGQEDLKVLEEVDGALIGISLSGNNTTRFTNRIIFRQLSISSAVQFMELFSGSTTTLPIAKQRTTNRLFFMLSGTFNGTTREGVWSVGRTSPTSPFSIVHERTPNNDTALTGGVLRGFFSIGDYMFISYVDNSVEVMSKTNDTEAYAVSGIRETTINQGMPGEDTYRKKKLYAIGVNYEAIPTSGEVKLELRVDNGSWNTVLTDSTVGSRFLEMAALSSGTAFTDGREFEFRISSKGTKITSLSYRYDILKTLV